jgi:thymidylate kinase
VKSERTFRARSRLTGVTMVCVAGGLLFLASFTVANDALSLRAPIFELAGLTLVVLVSLGVLDIGVKLLIYESVRPITVDEIRRRIAQQSRRGQMRALVHNPIVISLSGIDGSGKSTQLELVAKRFEERGLAYKYVRLRWACFISYVPLALCRILGYTEWKTNAREKKRYIVYSFHENVALATVWAKFFTLDLLARSFVRTKIPILNGYFVLCDRSEFDALIDLVVETRNYGLIESMVGKLLLSISQKGRATFLIDISEEEAFKRKKDTPSLDYLKDRRQLYLDMAKRLNMPVLEGKSTEESIHRQFVERFLAHYPFWYVNSLENA